MRAMTIAITACVLTAVHASAQKPPRPGAEIGFRAGWSHITEGNYSVDIVALPGAGIYATDAIYATLFVSPQLAVEPQFGGVRMSANGNSQTMLTLGGQLNYFFREPCDAPYVFVQGTARHLGGGMGSEDARSLGGGLGQRWVLGESLSLRLEGRYRRWWSDGPANHEFSALIAVGAVLD